MLPALFAVTVKLQPVAGHQESIALGLHRHVLKGTFLQRHLPVAAQADGIVFMVCPTEPVNCRLAPHHGGLGDKPVEDLKIVLALYVIGVVCGGALDLLGITV